MPGRTADVAIIGLGAMGSMAAWRLAERGVSVIGFERFQVGHRFGSSHGDTRMIRAAGRGPDYVPWVRQAFDLWRLLEQHSGKQLLIQTGALLIGRPEGHLVSSALEKSRLHGLRHQLLGPTEMRRRYPQHVLSDGEVAVLEDLAGVLRPEASITAAVGLAKERGAELLEDTEVLALEEQGSSITVTTDKGAYEAGRAVVAVGARTHKLLPNLGLPLEVERQALVWLEATAPTEYGAEKFPTFTHELAGQRYLYGFPTTDGSTVKLAVHHGGVATDPDTLDRQIHQEDLAPVIEFASQHLVGLGDVAEATVCMYTNTHDGLFHVTVPNGLSRAVVVNACNGDGFKFASVIGEALAAHLVEGTPLPGLLETSV